MLDLTRLPADLLDYMRRRKHTDAEIAAMHPSKVVEEYCFWKGLYGHGADIYAVAHAADAAVVPDPEAALRIVPPFECVCYACGKAIPEGSPASYDQGRGIRHLTCPSPA